MEDFNPLNMMCEVVMEERPDDEPVSFQNDNAFDLPPIPTFDLQSAPYEYIPVQPAIPLQLPTARVTPKAPPLKKATLTPPANPYNNHKICPADKPNRLLIETSEQVSKVPDLPNHPLSLTSAEETSFYNQMFPSKLTGTQSIDQ